MRNLTRSFRLAMLGVLAALLALSGCGGGGGGAASSGGGDDGGGGGTSLLEGVVPGAVSQFNNMGVYLPTVTDDGRITQSSTVDVNNFSYDPLSLVVDGAFRVSAGTSPTYRFSYNPEGGSVLGYVIDTSNLSSDVVHGTRTVIWRDSEIDLNTVRVGENGSVAVDTDGDGTNDGRIFINVTSDRVEPDLSMNYMAVGAWLYVPNSDEAADYEIGAFAQGSELPTAAQIRGVTGNATYNGIGHGFITKATGSSMDVDVVTYDAQFEADFGDESAGGTIHGSLTNIRGTRDYSDDSFTLQSATINSLSEGYVRGDLSGTVEGVDYSGNWGGQFYRGPYGAPAGFGGTAGGAGNGLVDAYSFTGAFGTYLQ